MARLRNWLLIGGLLTPGANILSVLRSDLKDDTSLEALIFVALSEGKRVAKGDVVLIQPSSLPAGTHDRIRATVLDVSDAPVTSGGVKRTLGNDGLAAIATAGGPPFACPCTSGTRWRGKVRLRLDVWPRSTTLPDTRHARQRERRHRASPASRSGHARAQAPVWRQGQHLDIGPVMINPFKQAPVVLQMEATECGAACLAMVLAAHGRWITLEEAREQCGTSRDGVNAASLLTAAKNYGMHVKALKREPEQLAELPMPQILHWRFEHFVVLESVRGQPLHAARSGRRAARGRRGGDVGLVHRADARDDSR
jgi:hypothetical protein